MRLVFLVLVVVVSGGACSKPCLEVGCIPKISVTYSSPIAGAYRLQVAVFGVVYPAIDCPRLDGPMTAESGVGCDALGFSVQGKELFRGMDPPSEITVQVDEISSKDGAIAAAALVTTRLSGSVNGDGCDMDCFRAQGVLTILP
jgi:hypothetical protein